MKRLKEIATEEAVTICNNIDCPDREQRARCYETVYVNCKLYDSYRKLEVVEDLGR
jgi:hypothetical protein